MIVTTLRAGTTGVVLRGENDGDALLWHAASGTWRTGQVAAPAGAAAIARTNDNAGIYPAAALGVGAVGYVLRDTFEEQTPIEATLVGYTPGNWVKVTVTLSHIGYTTGNRIFYVAVEYRANELDEGLDTFAPQALSPAVQSFTYWCRFPLADRDPVFRIYFFADGSVASDAFTISGACANISAEEYPGVTLPDNMAQPIFALPVL